MADLVRRTHGLEIAVLEPPMYQRVINGISNLLFVPLSWLLAVIDAEPPAWFRRSSFRVVVRNQRGQERTITLLSDGNAAQQEVEEVVSRIEELGLNGWAYEMRNRIPDSFFSQGD